MRAQAKKDIVKKFAEEMGITVKEAAAQWDPVMDFIAKEVLAGTCIRIKGLGTLYTVDRPAKECRVPGSDRIVAVPARIAVKLKGKSYIVEEV